MSRTISVPMWIDARGDEPAPRPALNWAPWIVLALLVLLAAACFTWLSLARHAAYQSHAFDLGNMDQAVWNTVHGRWLRFTDMDVHGQVLTSRFAIHVEPLLIVLSAFYLVHPGPETLLVIQALVVPLGAIPVYLLAWEALGSRWLALVFPAAYLLHPSLQNAVLDDFHAVSLSACFLAWALYFAYRGEVRLFAVTAVLAAATKEEVGLIVALLGLVLVYRRQAVAGLVTLVAGFCWFLVCVKLIIPAFNPGGQSPYLGRYAYLGHGLGGVLGAIVRHPLSVLHTLTSPARRGYLGDLLQPVGFVSLLGLPVFLLAAPALLINMLSSDARMYSGFYQYSAEIVPIAVGAAAIGAGALARLLGGREGASRGAPTGPSGGRRASWAALVLPAVCALILAGAVYDSWGYGFTPLAHGYIVPSAGPHQQRENAILAGIPSGAVVAAADEIEPHLSGRRWVYLLPTVHPRNGPSAQYIVLDASIPSSPVEPHTLHALAVRALRQGYGVMRAADGLLVLRRGAPAYRLPATFYSFVFGAGTGMTRVNARWGPLALVDVVVHPRDGLVNRARPAISLETYWQVTGRIPPGARIIFYLSPVYSGAHPPFSARWKAERDSPTWDWLPLAQWPRKRTIRAVSLPLVPPPLSQGSVDVAVGVEGLGPVSGGRLLRGTRAAVLVGTIATDD